MANTTVFVGNIAPGIIAVGIFGILPGHFIRLDDKFTTSEILHNERLIEAVALGYLFLRYGGTTWSDSTPADSLADLYAALDASEQAIGAGV